MLTNNLTPAVRQEKSEFDSINTAIAANADFTSVLEKAIAKVRQLRVDLNNVHVGSSQHSTVAMELIEAHREYLNLVNSLSQNTDI